MIIVVILLVLALGVVSGYAARQRQTMRENTDSINELAERMEVLVRENESLRENADTVGEQAVRIEALVRENEGLRHDKHDHEASLEMVLAELDQSA